MLTLDAPALGEHVALQAAAFERHAGAELEVTRVRFAHSYPQTLLGQQQESHDMTFFGSMWIADVHGNVQRLPPRMLRRLEQCLADGDARIAGCAA